ncbi:hypothetical protein D2L64_13390 [Micromonospora radicis]|uniref:Uncharacterized protein n=1 Tax=Micromonospora radicis TaxID=1894971 RepID=A0A418MU60_9ACTN|nr:hypothetical protein D2L64_13390 [Micromonospora radicis]
MGTSVAGSGLAVRPTRRRCSEVDVHAGRLAGRGDVRAGLLEGGLLAGRGRIGGCRGLGHLGPELRHRGDHPAVRAAAAGHLAEFLRHVGVDLREQRGGRFLAGPQGADQCLLRVVAGLLQRLAEFLVAGRVGGRCRRGRGGGRGRRRGGRRGGGCGGGRRGRCRGGCPIPTAGGECQHGGAGQGKSRRSNPVHAREP